LSYHPFGDLKELNIEAVLGKCFYVITFLENHSEFESFMPAAQRLGLTPLSLFA
jgi:hypothetical protein